ncbi:MAG: hypothetical protein LBG31_05910 [Prevotellaceae bacterium]|jgi:hypothetical protein|nr:hypothetical protein [Prevotellaceae bacterium]
MKNLLITLFFLLPALSGNTQSWSRYGRAYFNAAPSRYWHVGIHGGLPFFWGDFTSTAAGKTYTGYLAGVQAGYRFNSFFGMSLSLEYAANKAGARDYAMDYLMDAGGMTYYIPQPFDTKRYGDLYAAIAMFGAGLHADFNANRIFGKNPAAAKLKLIVSPAVYLQHFRSEIYTRAEDALFAAPRRNKPLSLGLGGSVALRYDFHPAIGVELKGAANWITDNHFDNIVTVGYVAHNALWSMTAGLVWKIHNH